MFDDEGARQERSAGVLLQSLLLEQVAVCIRLVTDNTFASEPHDGGQGGSGGASSGGGHLGDKNLRGSSDEEVAVKKCRPVPELVGDFILC